jgi:tripartite-type tricarboxylate transporter receptor subunit TctC
VQTLHKAVRQAATAPAMIANLNERGVLPPEEMTPAAFEKMMAERLVKFGQVVRTAGITAE